MEIVIPEVGGIDDDILLTIKDDILHEKLLNVNLLIDNIEALNDNPASSSNFMTKSSSTSLNSLLEETFTFDNSLPELETFCFDLEEISSVSTTTHSDISLPEYEAFYDDHVKEISSGSTTTYSYSSLYDSFIFDLLINPFPPTDRSVTPLIDYHCYYKCGDSLNDFFCHPCTCEFYGNGAHVGYNCPVQVPSIQTLPSLPQQYPCCEDCGDLLEAHQCQPPQYIVNHLEGRRKIAAKAQNWKLPVCYDDDDDEERSIYLKDNIISRLPPCVAFTPSLSTEEPDHSLSMGDEHLDTVSAMKSNEFINSSVENLVLTPCEFEGIPDNMFDVSFHDNSSPLGVLKDQFEDFSDSNDESTSTDDDSFSIDNIEYVEASPPDPKLVSSEVMEIVIPKVGGIDDDILLTIKDDILREKLLNVNHLIANIEALNDNPTLSFDFMTKSSSTSLNSLLEETNTFDNSLPEFEIFCFDLEEISSGSTTTHSDISLPKYEAFYDDQVKKISNGSTTTHFDSSLYDSFIFDLSINPFPSADMSDFYEFADELAYIISPPEYDCFYFKNEPNSGDFTIDVVEDTFPTREPRVHNTLPTQPTLQLNLDFILSSEFLFTYVVWIFLPFLLYSVSHQHLLSFGNEDIIFNLGICSYHISSFLPDVSHRSGTFIKFKVLNESPMEILFSTCSPIDQWFRGRVRLKTRLTNTSASWEAPHAYP
nr:hypothetical protein [Tanacetum cinerariifolium]